MTAIMASTLSGTPVSVHDLTLRVGGRALLVEANAHFEPGEITLIVGPSGAGKSTLLRVLARLAGPSDCQVSGSVLFNGKSGKKVPVGLVFQKFALFDELSPVDNVRLAHAHRPAQNQSHKQSPAPEELLAELGVPRDVATSALSGGQQQRLAIARTLAYDPAIMLYDEPTSGLDTATAERVAQLIRRTQEHHPKTSIVVTHDFETLTAIADRVYLLDPVKKALCEIPREQWSGLGDMMRSLALENARDDQQRETGVGLHLRNAIGFLLAFFSGTTRVLEELLALPLRLLPLWKSLHWGARFCVHYLRLVAGPLAMLYVAIAGVVAGFVATYFTFRFLPYKQITEPLILENVLDALGFSLYRILVPVLITILVAARCGAAVTSDVGGKVHGRQIDALRTLGISPERYLLTPILYAFLLGTPLLTLIAFWLARITSLGVFTATHPEWGPHFWHVHFHRTLSVEDGWLFRGSGWLLAKVWACAAGIALSAYLVGMRPKRSARDVSAAITHHILLATIFVLFVHLGFALFEFDR
jgi:ABC-type multidrug transport system ATPase subunit/ABC-type transporter Mla maintaining outer membrane lipid asymmetry permease subunit MlaE